VKKKTLLLTKQEDMLIDLTIHDFPIELFTAFTKKIVKPYFSGNTNQAIKTLIQKTLNEEEITKNHIIPNNF